MRMLAVLLVGALALVLGMVLGLNAAATGKTPIEFLVSGFSAATTSAPVTPRVDAAPRSAPAARENLPTTATPPAAARREAAPATPTLRPSESTPTPPDPSPTAAIPIRVYFSRHPESDDAFTAVFPVDRTAPDRGVAGAALRHLAEGPTPAERSAGYFSELGAALVGPSNCGGSDVQLTLRDGTAIVRFCRQISSAGVGQDARIRSQLDATLRQFSTIRRVRLLDATGHCLFDESGQDRCSEEPPGAPRPTGSG